MLRGEGGIKALLGMVHCGHPDVLAQVARGIANFAKCESRSSAQGTYLLITKRDTLPKLLSLLRLCPWCHLISDLPLRKMGRCHH